MRNAYSIIIISLIDKNSSASPGLPSATAWGAAAVMVR